MLWPKKITCQHSFRRRKINLFFLIRGLISSLSCQKCSFLMLLLGLPKWHSGKECSSQCRRHTRHGFDPWIGESPWRRNGNTPAFSPGRYHGPRNLAGYSPWGCKESDTTEWLGVHACKAACYLFVLSSTKKRWPKLFLSISYAFFVGNKKGSRNFQNKSIIKNMIYFIFFNFFFIFFISWRLITLQYCSGFCHTLNWISHGFTCVSHPDSPLPPPSPPNPSRSSQCTRS